MYCNKMLMLDFSIHVYKRVHFVNNVVVNVHTYIWMPSNSCVHSSQIIPVSFVPLALTGISVKSLLVNKDHGWTWIKDILETSVCFTLVRLGSATGHMVSERRSIPVSLKLSLFIVFIRQPLTALSGVSSTDPSVLYPWSGEMTAVTGWMRWASVSGVIQAQVFWSRLIAPAFCWTNYRHHCPPVGSNYCESRAIECRISPKMKEITITGYSHANPGWKTTRWCLNRGNCWWGTASLLTRAIRLILFTIRPILSECYFTRKLWELVFTRCQQLTLLWKQNDGNFQTTLTTLRNGDHGEPVWSRWSNTGTPSASTHDQVWLCMHGNRVHWLWWLSMLPEGNHSTQTWKTQLGSSNEATCR